MTRPRPELTRAPARLAWGLGWAALAVLVLFVAAVVFWRVEIQRGMLDPGVPYQIYKPPPSPDYGKDSAWALPSGNREPAAGGAEVFYVHDTDYSGGREWNAPLGERDANARLGRVDLPNYAGPFQSLGRVFAPRYRQASLYSFTTLRDDAREARRLPLQDVEAAFAEFLRRAAPGRPLILAGAGQGGELLSRVVAGALARAPALRQRLAAVYLIHVIEPADAHGPGAPLPACDRRAEARCLVAWRQAPDGGATGARALLNRALVWSEQDQLVNLDARPALCVNPLTGAVGQAAAAERANLGAADATGLEWGVRPAFLPRQVSAECRGGLLQVSAPRSTSFKPAAGWLEPLRAPPFNLFYADIEADARGRLAALGASLGGAPAPPITAVETVRSVPIHRIN